MGVTVRGMAITACHGKCSFVISSEARRAESRNLTIVRVTLAKSIDQYEQADLSARCA